MMKLYFTWLSLLLFGATATAQDSEIFKKLRGKYDVVWPHVDDGIILINNGGQRIAQPEKSNGRYGYADTLGRIIVPPTYEYGERFHDGFAIVGRSGRRGAIDRTGREVVACEWDDLSKFENGVAIATDKRAELPRYSLIDTAGRATALPYDFCGRGFACGYAIVGTGKYEADERPLSAGISNGKPRMKFSGKYGYITPDGELAIPIQYDEACDFGADGLARVGMQGKYYVKWGFIDVTGNTVIPCNYYSAGNFQYGRALVSKVAAGGKLLYGYLDRSGKEVIPCKFDEATSFRFANTWVGIVENGETLYSLIDRNGNAVLGFSVCNLQDGGEYGHAVAAISDETGTMRYGIVGFSGKIVLPFEYDSITIFSDLNPETMERSEAAIATKGGRNFRLKILEPKK